MKLLVLDNYDSFTFNLVHILRKLNIDFEVHRNNRISLEEASKFDKFLFSPGPGTPENAGILKELIHTYKADKPMLGVCLGHQAIAEVFGAELENLSQVYHGVPSTIYRTSDDMLLKGLPDEFTAGRYHSWNVKKDGLPAELTITATDEKGEIMALSHKEFNIYGVQFHPESIMSQYGDLIIKNFLDQ